MNAAHVLEEFGIAYTEKRSVNLDALPEHERALLALLLEPVSVDTIHKKTQIAIPSLISHLSGLELKGLVRNVGQDVYQRII